MVIIRVLMMKTLYTLLRRMFLTGRKASINGRGPNANFPPPKTDKPRPHVCGTCSRSFARLEHLKRHERSHTKEKPFECPECTRCFARRDLLLRHQQKLHMTVTPSRPRNGRRESSGSAAAGGPGRVRKNSVASSAVGGAAGTGPPTRPRANTISHVDGATMGMIAAANSSAARNGNMRPGHSHHASLTGLPGPGGYEFRGMSAAAGHHGNLHGLPKLDTSASSHFDGGAGLRTAPPYGGFHSGFDVDGLLLGGPGSTINPAQLHFDDSQSLAMGTPTPYQQAFPMGSGNGPLMEDDDSFEWMSGFDNQMSFMGANEQAVDESSPSAMSTTSQSGISEVMLDGSNNPAQSSGNMWHSTSMMPPAQMAPAFSMDLPNPVFPEMISPPRTVSPKSLHGQNGGNDPYFSTPPPLTSASSATQAQVFHPPMTFNADTPSTSSASISGSARQSSITSVSTDSITDATRQALLTSLSHPSHFSHSQRKYSATSAHQPLSPCFDSKAGLVNASLPSTRDLQRYVAAYIQYFHPHLPFLHLGTLSFDSPAFADSIQSAHSGLIGGGGCLVLAMAAIGALYEFEAGPSKELFESSKRMLQIYLEERRKADVNAAHGGATPVQTTPLWLVQAMLLNVVYGINCGDKTSADIASTHCAALVSLAHSAELTQPLPFEASSQHHPLYPGSMYGHRPGGEDIHMGDDGMSASTWNLGTNPELPDDQIEWVTWKVAEERKRTLYAVFILSSLLVAAYNHAPALTNSEILLDLPCDEDLWAAESALAWNALGGLRIAEQKAITFSTALGTLLSASQRQGQNFGMPAYQQPFGSGVPLENIPESDLKPSTFGCLVLINALHNYIWETRQRHHSRQWTTQETEAMHSHIEPALKAWQAAWASDPHHSLERPNPFGKSPLSADCVPLLDLAYVRLFVNLGRSKEAFWQRDFDVMANELARGSEFVQHADLTSASTSGPADLLQTGSGSPSRPMTTHDSASMIVPLAGDDSGQSTKRERHLRKAAFYAADSLSISDKLGVTFADFTSRELPLQSAMCSFDCAQVLAEWVSTVQERVGRYLGVLGKDEIDYGQVPAIMLLEEEDCKLLEKIVEFVGHAEAKTAFDASSIGAMGQMTSEDGYGSKILRVTASMLDKAGVWGVTILKARALETQAVHMKSRADNSVMPRA